MLNSRTLLIVDDCAEDRKIYRRYLLKDTHFSYEIVDADSAETGLSLWQQMQFDAILLDFCLPDMSGFEFLERLENQKINNYFDTHSSVIMLTGQGNEKVAVQAMKKGIQDYLVKQNLKADVLQLAVRNAIKQSCLQTQLSKKNRQQRLIATTALRIRESLDLEQILHTAVAEVQQLLKCDRVVLYQFALGTAGEKIVQSLASNRQPLECTSIFNSYEIAAVGASNHWQCQGEICNIYAASVHQPDHPHEVFEQLLNRQANLIVPINLSQELNHEARIWGLLVAHQCQQESQTAKIWQPDEVEMLNEVAVQLAIAIQQAELLAQTQASLNKEKQLNGFKSQFIATVSHEYRTPLASILAAASTLKQHGDKLDDCKQQRFLEMIEDKARHLSKLIDEVLQVNQIELEKTKFKPIPLDLLQFFSELMEQQRLTVGEKHELTFKINGNCQGFWGDRGLLRQIFINLISNAIKYSPDGGDIEFHLIGKDTEIIFSIQDNGIGIPSQEQKNLFQSFSRASNVDTIPGTGLGLAIAKSCVDLHGGNIALDSRIGQGTKVTVTLPKRQN
ncbi:ATP-binding protein [Calothrix sp. UHCC 0171]|uniref:hybrid sensor histidine kinase/response regulator n=1 Tax=Calothrix sp. UHCC 0171 TaxID=3110245 RepID=UPI002B21D0F0|nr:ATP-binding protein [Calothrix sp. UHCC 0171]MEA5573096.1 ATP-binding protein [Calothrix sp. UHCC 0171]